MQLPPTLSLTFDGDVARLTLNAPERLNALSSEMLLGIPIALSKAAAGGARALVLTGVGRGFCSGAQLGSQKAGEADHGDGIDTYYNPMAQAFADAPFPIVTAINGAAAGAGASIALAGDIVLAARSSYIMLAFVKVGLVPDAGATWLVAKAAGRIRALELALLGDRMSAVEALANGLVTRVVEDADLIGEAMDIARRLAAMPTRALVLIRDQVRTALDEGFAAGLRAERDNQRTAGFTEDHKEGVAAFLEKRAAIFQGR